ncbi:TPA: hypothetical protein ENS27_11460 [bacterium]|nr:hypothetical protein [bacterium]
MKKTISLLVIGLFVFLAISAMAVDVSETATHVKIKTAGYEVHWKKAAQMGFTQVFVAGDAKSIVGEAGRAFYHSGDYGGWKDWGALKEWKTVEKAGVKAVVNFKSFDGGAKDYDVTVTFYDTVPYIKHQVKVTNTGDAVIKSFQAGHAPMFEINADTAGMTVGTKPFNHVVMWTATGYYAGLYGPEANEARKHDWGGKPNGRMDLVHDNAAKDIKKGESHTITYYTAFGKGGEKEALALAEKVREEPILTSVSPIGALTTTWGHLRSE